MSKTLEITIKVREATPEDLKIDDQTLKFGQPFWLKSMINGKFDNKAYIINGNTDPQDLASWLKNKMIYVPADPFN